MTAQFPLVAAGEAQQTSSGLAGLLDRCSDKISPIVVKEVRQMVRGREFNYSFTLSLLAGLLISAFGGADAGIGNLDAGSGIFSGLVVCLTFIGIFVVPMGTLHTLRSERAEQTLDLMTLTDLAPRRIILGKLLAQAVKLVTLFAGLSPFMAMSFLLGGIDFLTILTALVAIFMWSLWACALSLFVSCLSKSRVMGPVFFVVLLLPIALMLGAGPTLYVRMILGPPIRSGPFSAGSWEIWWMFANMTTICFTSMANLVLLGENRLTLPTEDRSTALRVGFLAQFLLIVAATILPVLRGTYGWSAAAAVDLLIVFGGIQLAVVAIFSVTEDLTPSRRVLRYDLSPGRWSWLRFVFRPGGGRGATYVLVQMAVLVLIGALLKPAARTLLQLVATCGYICFFTGVPALVGRVFAPARSTAAGLRVAVLLFFPVLMLSADLFTYLLTPLKIFDGSYSVYHVLNPFRTLANWPRVHDAGWSIPVLLMGVLGLLCYLKLIKLGHQAIETAREEHAGATH